MDALTALLDERRRYEAWLAQLEAKRAETPLHVFDKVRSDYDTRLRSVTEQLRSRAAEVETSVRSLEERVNAMQIEESARRDERSEAELRAAVGEYHPEHARDMLARCDEEIERIATERESLAAELGHLQEILALARRPGMEEARRTPAVQPATSAPPPQPVTARAAPAPGFDELAFLQSVVQPREAPPSPAPASEPDVLQNAASRNAAPAIEPTARRQDGALRATSPTPMKNTPPFLKDMPTEQVKTLKCQECGTMNYPTEWYCERCGGELAAM
jgi:hypothetical protein